MKPTDVRLLNDDQQFAVRQRAIYMVYTLGLSHPKAARLMGVDRKSIDGWCTKFEQLGPAGAAPRADRSSMLPSKPRSRT